MSDSSKIRGISRMDYKSVAPGWFARYTREGVTFRRHFSDSEFGSPEASLEAAKQWHLEARRLLPPIDRREYAEIRKGNNKSGIVGVYRTSSIAKGKRYAVWVASWSPSKGKKAMKSFSILEYGEEGAKQLAIQAREEALAKLKTDWPEDYWEYRGRSDSGAEREAAYKSKYLKDVFAFEGQQEFRTHQVRERDRNLRDAKIEEFLERHGELFCEICGFSFEREYGELGQGLIEVHHSFPLSKMTENHKTRLEDLICICSNCHLAIHNGDPYVNLQKLRFIFDAKSKNAKMKTKSGAAPEEDTASP